MRSCPTRNSRSVWPGLAIAGFVSMPTRLKIQELYYTRYSLNQDPNTLHTFSLTRAGSLSSTTSLGNEKPWALHYFHKSQSECDSLKDR